MSHNKQINVLMVSLFYHGHINPMVHFAEFLTTKGVHVTLATTSHARDQVLNGLAKHNNFIDFEFFDDGLDAELDRDKNLGILIEEYLPKEGKKNLSNLITTLKEKGKNFACIINNCFVPWVANVAPMHNIPCAMLWVQSCATYGIYYHYYHKNIPQLSALKDPINHAFKILGLPLFKTEDLPTFILPSSPPYFLNVVMTTISILDQFQWIFGSSFCDIEESLVHSMMQFKPILPIGPLVSPFMLKVEDDAQEDVDENDICIDWLNKQGASSVIYIALGSISVMSQSETESLANVLESDSNKRFLWVRKGAEKGMGEEMAELPKGFLENTKERGLIVPWCSQAKVLMHPSIGCYLTHCGWNSTLEAITAGVPVIAYPDWTDQLTNAKLLVDVFKVGVRMRKSNDCEILKKEEIERCLVEVTKGPRALALKEQAIKWKLAAKNARSSAGSSNMNLEIFINELRLM